VGITPYPRRKPKLEVPVKRSLLEPLPRQLSTTALAALVALVVCGTGVAVARYLESSQGPFHAAPSAVRAAPPATESNAPRPTRTSPRDTSAYSSGAATSTDATDMGCSTRSASACGESPAREVQPTLYRPPGDGS